MLKKNVTNITKVLQGKNMNHLKNFGITTPNFKQRFNNQRP